MPGSGRKETGVEDTAGTAAEPEPDFKEDLGYEPSSNARSDGAADPFPADARAGQRSMTAKTPHPRYSRR